jgi:hypothetical protein
MENKKKVTYDDILNNLGMCNIDGKLYFSNNNTLASLQTNKQHENEKQTNKVETFIQPNQQNYIYNKYFKNYIQEDQPPIPKNLKEYQEMLLKKIIHNHKMKSIKSKKLITINNNLHQQQYTEPSQLFKLF